MVTVSSDMFIQYDTTWCSIPVGSSLHRHHCENMQIWQSNLYLNSVLCGT